MLALLKMGLSPHPLFGGILCVDKSDKGHFLKFTPNPIPVLRQSPRITPIVNLNEFYSSIISLAERDRCYLCMPDAIFCPNAHNVDTFRLICSNLFLINISVEKLEEAPPEVVCNIII